jgi:hypothetical protein
MGKNKNIDSNTQYLKPEDVQYEILNHIVKVENHLNRIKWMVWVFMGVIFISQMVVAFN